MREVTNKNAYEKHQIPTLKTSESKTKKKQTNKQTNQAEQII